MPYIEGSIMERKEEKKKSALPKILLTTGGALAVVALCVLSSRFSWFGTAVSASSATESATTSASVSSVVQTAEISNQTDTPDSSADTAVTDHSSAISEETTLPASETTDITTTTTQATTTATTTTTTTKATTPATSPAPLWSESEASGQMYITVDCYSRKKAVIGAETAELLKRSTLVTVVAITDTGYYKLDNGYYVHSDYLSKTKPAETTTTATTVTTTSSTSATTTTTPPVISSGNITDEPVNCLPVEAEVFRLVNIERAKYGLAPYKWDSTAYAAAKIRCDEIKNTFSHTRPNGYKYHTVYGYNEEDYNNIFYCNGENIASGYETAKEVVEAWMNSTKGHRENILSSKFQNMAISFSTTNDIYVYYWAQEFTTYR